MVPARKFLHMELYGDDSSWTSLYLLLNLYCLRKNSLGGVSRTGWCWASCSSQCSSPCGCRTRRRQLWWPPWWQPSSKTLQRWEAHRTHPAAIANIQDFYIGIHHCQMKEMWIRLWERIKLKVRIKWRELIIVLCICPSKQFGPVHNQITPAMSGKTGVTDKWARADFVRGRNNFRLTPIPILDFSQPRIDGLQFALCLAVSAHEFQ